MEIFKLFGSIFVDTTEADKNIEKTGKKGEGLAGKLGGIAKAAGKWALGIGAAAITVASSIGGMAVSTAQDIDKAIDSYIVATGGAKESTEQYQKVLENIYKNNYGEDFQDIADSMAQVKQQLGDISDEELQNVTEDALALRDSFDFEVNESVRAAKMLMDQFGLSAEEAYNLIAQGAQQGLDKNGDLLDSINEYSVHFAQAGLNATDMFNTFKSGAESGAFSVDKIGDAIKEMGIRMRDGTANDALTSMKLDADEITSAFAEGGERASWAFGEVINGLNNIQDPLQQNQAGVQLFGTMWEDLGAEAVLAMTQYGDQFNETIDTMDQLKEVKYDNLTDMWEALRRNVEMLVLPLGNSLMPILTQVIQLIVDNMPTIQGMIEQIAPVISSMFTQLLPPLMELIQSIMPVFLQLIQQLLPFFTQIIQTILPVIVQLIQMLLPPIMQIVQSILPILIQLIQPLLSLLQPLINLLQPIINLFMTLLQPLIELINMVLPPLISLFTEIINFILPALQNALSIVSEVLGGAFKGAFDAIKPILDNVINIFKNIIDFVKNVFTGNWQGAWENVKNIFKNIADGLGNIFKAPINFIRGIINGFIRGLNNIKIPDWVPGVGGFGINIPEIPKLKVGMDYVPEDDFPAFLHKGERVLTKEQNAAYNKNLQEGPTSNTINEENKNKTINEGNIIINIEKFVNNTDIDIQTLAENLAFYYKSKKKAKGGAY